MKRHSAIAGALKPTSGEVFFKDERITGEPQHVVAKVILAANREEGASVVLVEQNSQIALQIAHRAYVLEAGKLARPRSSSRRFEMRLNPRRRPPVSCTWSTSASARENDRVRRREDRRAARGVGAQAGRLKLRWSFAPPPSLSRTCPKPSWGRTRGRRPGPSPPLEVRSSFW